jgi:uncharacterized OB-fold protein
VNPLSDTYYEGLERGELLIQTCRGCGTDNMYPRARCPVCYEPELDWKRAAGRGSLYSYTVLRAGPPTGFEGELPYGLGVVRLEEGVQILGRLAKDDTGGWDAYECDVPVEFCAPPTRAEGRPPAAGFRLARERTGNGS